MSTPPYYPEVFSSLFGIAAHGAPLTLPELIAGTEDWRWQAVEGLGRSFTTKIKIPDIDWDKDHDVEAMITVTVLALPGDTLFVQTSMVWETSDGERHESHARYRFTPTEFGEFIKYVARNSSTDVVIEVPDGVDFDQLLDDHADEIFAVLDDAAGFHTDWLQRRPGDEFGPYRGRQFMEHDDRHAEYHVQLIRYLLDAGTLAIAMLRPDTGLAHPQDLERVLEWIEPQVDAE